MRPAPGKASNNPPIRIPYPPPRQRLLIRHAHQPERIRAMARPVMRRPQPVHSGLTDDVVSPGGGSDLPSS